MRVVIATVIVVSSFVCAHSQQARKTNLPEERIPIGCENNSAQLGRAGERFVSAGADRVLIAVARLGTGEASRELNRRRLFNVRNYLEHYRGVPAKRIVTAEGEKVRGYGRVDLYVGGTLVETLLADKGKDLCVTCCGDYSDFYPDLLKYERHRGSLPAQSPDAPAQIEQHGKVMEFVISNGYFLNDSYKEAGRSVIKVPGGNPLISAVLDKAILDLAKREPDNPFLTEFKSHLYLMLMETRQELDPSRTVSDYRLKNGDVLWLGSHVR